MDKNRAIHVWEILIQYEPNPCDYISKMYSNNLGAIHKVLMTHPEPGYIGHLTGESGDNSSPDAFEKRQKLRAYLIQNVPENDTSHNLGSSRKINKQKKANNENKSELLRKCVADNSTPSLARQCIFAIDGWEKDRFIKNEFMNKFKKIL